jgi:hypothetical protein
MTPLNKSHKKRFKKSIDDLNKLLIDVKVEHPDACYYLFRDSFCLMPDDDSRKVDSLAEKVLTDASGNGL